MMSDVCLCVIINNNKIMGLKSASASKDVIGDLGSRRVVCVCEAGCIRRWTLEVSSVCG